MREPNVVHVAYSLVTISGRALPLWIRPEGAPNDRAHATRFATVTAAERAVERLRALHVLGESRPASFTILSLAEPD